MVDDKGIKQTVPIVTNNHLESIFLVQPALQVSLDKASHLAHRDVEAHMLQRRQLRPGQLERYVGPAANGVARMWEKKTQR